MNSINNPICCTKIKNFSVKRDNNEILKDINLHIHCGDLTAVIGPNGAGKSTLLKAILGEVKHTGQLEYVGESESYEGKPLIGYVPQHLNFDLSSPISVFDLFLAVKTNSPVWFYRSSKIRQQIIEKLKIVQADYVIDRRIGNLSGGELQRVLLALALDPIPNILLLDEPVSGMDQTGLELFYDLVCQIRNKYDLSIILVSHDLPLISKHADRVVLLNKEVLCCGTPKEVYSNKEFTNIFGEISYEFNGCSDGRCISCKFGIQ